MKILIKQRQSPGDIIMLTAAVRDLKKAYPYIKVNVRTSCMELWANNPYISHDVNESNADRILDLEYPLIHSSNHLPYHFIHAFRKELQLQLGLPIPQGEFHGEVYLSTNERNPLPELANKRYWVIDAGYKLDCPAKHWGTEHYQKLVELLSGKVEFVQIGERNPKHIHPPLKGVIDMIGKTNPRELIRLMYHAAGVVTPISFPMHLSAAVPTFNKSLRPCIVLAGGREPAHWEAYPGHQFMHTIGMLDCCRARACWKSVLTEQENKGICSHPVQLGTENIGKCMTLITPERVTEAILLYEDNR